MNNNERRVEVNDVLFSFSVSVAASSDAVHQFYFLKENQFFIWTRLRTLKKRLKQVIIFQDKIIKYLEYKI